MNAKMVILADLGFVKAYKLARTPKGTAHLDLLEQVVLEEAHHRLVESVTALSARRAPPTQPNRAAPLDDAHNRELETQRRLIKEIVAHVERLSQNQPEWGICFAAPNEINHLVVGELTRKVKGRIQVNLSRDLVKADKPQLLECFAAAA